MLVWLSPHTWIMAGMRGARLRSGRVHGGLPRIVHLEHRYGACDTLALQGLRTGRLVQERAIEIMRRGSIRLDHDHVFIPDPVEKWLR